MRPAFTLVEILVAIVIFTVGVLALAATAGLVAAHVGDGGRLTRSAHVARTVLDSLRSLPCDRVRGGAVLDGNVTATWTTTRDSLTVAIDLTVQSALRRSSARHSYSAVVECAR